MLAKPEYVGRDAGVGVIDKESRSCKKVVEVKFLYKLTGIRYEPEGLVRCWFSGKENSAENKDWFPEERAVKSR